MSVTRTLARAAAGSATVLAIGAALASPASAAPHISTLACDIGAGQVYCLVYYNNAVPPVTIRWTINGVPIPAANDNRELYGTCSLNKSTTVGVTVTDPTGSAHVSHTQKCGPVIP